MYKRKTYDVWELYIDYGYGDGWEYVLTEKSLPKPESAEKNMRRTPRSIPQKS